MAVNQRSPHPARKYITEIAPVREVTLVGAADLAFWREHLRGQGLFPYDDHGSAELMISATDSTYMGVRFREVSFSVAVSTGEDAGIRDSMYLVHAFNSVPVFAWAERTFFQTPYYHAAIEVDARAPAGVSVRDGKQQLFSARMSGKAPRSRSGDEVWEVTIFLPRAAAKPRQPRRFFVARLSGHTEIYPCIPELDAIELPSARQDTALYWLTQSNFRGTEWRIRGNATHARSKTYQS